MSFSKHTHPAAYYKHSTKTKRYKDFLKYGLRLSPASMYYYYKNRFYQDCPGISTVNLICKNTQWEKNVKARFIREGLRLTFSSQEIIEPVKPLKRVDLLIMD